MSVVVGKWGGLPHRLRKSARPEGSGSRCAAFPGSLPFEEKQGWLGTLVCVGRAAWSLAGGLNSPNFGNPPRPALPYSVATTMVRGRRAGFSHALLFSCVWGRGGRGRVFPHQNPGSGWEGGWDSTTRTATVLRTSSSTNHTCGVAAAPGQRTMRAMWRLIPLHTGQAVSPILPITTWRGDSDWCQHEHAPPQRGEAPRAYCTGALHLVTLFPVSLLACVGQAGGKTRGGRREGWGRDGRRVGGLGVRSHHEKHKYVLKYTSGRAGGGGG